MNRRDFMRRSGLGLAGILAACAAPGIVRAAHIMPVRQLHEIGSGLTLFDGRRQALCRVPFMDWAQQYGCGIRYFQSEPGVVERTGVADSYELRDRRGRLVISGTVEGPYGAGRGLVLGYPQLVAGSHVSVDFFAVENVLL